MTQARRLAFGMVRSGVSCGELDGAVNDFLRREGYSGEDMRLHRTGHGVGLGNHEAPSIAERQRIHFAENMVISIEPGIYLTILRDLIGNPFRPATLDPAWLAVENGTIVNLARPIYDEDVPYGCLDASRLEILADALEEAGCTNADILAHCRSPGPHLRGCWVVIWCCSWNDWYE